MPGTTNCVLKISTREFKKLRFTMEQLSGSHSLFLHTERGNVHNHVAALGIYDPSTAPGGNAGFNEIFRYVGRRTRLHKQFRQRVLSVPLGLDRPYWIEAPDIDLHFHIRHVMLPQPGDWQQLMAEVAAIHSLPLDRSRPLWEIHVLEGLDGIPDLPRDSFAVLQKYHHCAGDGQQLVALMCGVHSLSPRSEVGKTDSLAMAEERPPSATKLYALAVKNGIRRAASLCSLSRTTLRRVARAGAAAFVTRSRDGSSTDPAMSLPGFVRAPSTRFNAKVSASRTVGLIGLPLSAMKRAQMKLDGVTVNDIFLAVVGGALRKYLEDKRELPGESLVALMPLGGRDARARDGVDDEAPGVPTPVRSDIADPVGRLLACHAGSRAARARVEVLSKDFPRSLMDHLPNGIAEVFLRRYIYPHLNVTVSNVRGPDEILYMAGAQLTRIYLLSIATDYLGLNHSGFSYNGMLWASAVGCREILPDADVYARYLRESFDDLIIAVDLLPDAGTDSQR
jgi:diacylglycerol O-acyltransferase / wax synthase